jgi:hypothetical protein
MPKNRKGKNVRHELESDTEYKGLSEDLDIVDPNTGELISEKEYLRRFNDEWYYATRNTPKTADGKKDFRVITSEDGKVEAERNNNRNKRDVMSVAERSGTLDNLNGTEKDFMQEASDAWEWQDVYKYAGPAHAKHVIFEQTKRDIEEAVLDLDIILSRFVVKMLNLKRYNERKRKGKLK